MKVTFTRYGVLLLAFIGITLLDRPCFALEQKSEITAADLRAKGNMYDQRTGYSKALEYLNDALKLYRKAGDKRGTAGNLGDIAAVFIHLGDYNKALRYCDESLKIYRGLKDNAGIARTLGNMAIVYFRLEDIFKALDYNGKSLMLARELSDKYLQTASLETSGVIYASINNYKAALKYFGEALKINKDLNDRSGIANNLHNIGFTYYVIGDYPKALESLQEALRIAVEINDYEIGYRAIFHLGKVYEKNNDPGKALDCYKKSVAILESVRTRLKTEEHKLSFSENKRYIYETTVWFLLMSGRIEESFDYAERAREHSLLDMLANRISPKSQDQESASLTSVESLKSKEIQKLLDNDTTLLEYFVTQDRLIIWILTNNSLDVTAVRMKEAELTEAVSAFRKSVMERTDEYKETSRWLYGQLIDPAKRYLKTKKLCIVAHKALHYLPFSALLKEDKFLIEDYSISYSPSASALKFCLEKRKKTAASLLAFGNPDNSLKNAQDEVNSIKKDFSESDIFTGAGATETKAKETAKNYGIIHFACHAQLDPKSPLYSHLNLAKDLKHDGRLEVWEIYGMDLRSASLVTLSACQTALGRITGADEIIGLSRGFIYAGSPSVLSSLWNIDDASTSLLMQEFYSGLKDGRSKAESLRASQLKLIKEKSAGQGSGERGIKLAGPSKPTDYSHPYYWGAFVLIGDWE